MNRLSIGALPCLQLPQRPKATKATDNEACLSPLSLYRGPPEGVGPEHDGSEARSAALTIFMSGPPLTSTEPPRKTRTVVTPFIARSIA
jgi:hypothetical protein